jgi:hypothetical protein
MFFINSRDFVNNSLSFDFNIAKHICLFLHVFYFDLSNIKRTQSFAMSFFLEILDREKKSAGNAMRKEIGGTHGPTTSLHGGALLPLVRPFNEILDFTDLS